MSAETSSIDLDSESSKVAEEEEEKKKEEGSSADEGGELSAEKKKLTDHEATDFCAWMTSVLGSKVKSVKVSKRLSDSPALVTDHESGALRRMMKMVVSTCLVFSHASQIRRLDAMPFCIGASQCGIKQRRASPADD